jgi:glycosyltransferase involved in cell wall biosynthesis
MPELRPLSRPRESLKAAAVRILHAISTVDPATGGPVEGLRQISRINVDYGHEVEVVTADTPDSPWVKSFPFPVHALGPAYTSYVYTPRLVPWLKENAQRFDCVVVNGIWGYNLYAVSRALRGRVPYYVYTHGMLDPWFKYRYPLKHLKKWLFWPWGMYAPLREAHAVLFTCDEERLLARDSFWLYDCNEIVVRYGTPGVPITGRDYATAFVRRYPGLENKRRFVFLGRVHPKKGADLLLKAIARLQRNGIWDPSTMRLVMAGPVDGPYAATLKALASRLGVDESIVWTGMLLGDDKWGALQCAEAFVLPSHQENFGIAVAEALSCGVPVLLSRCVNIWREIVADGAGLVDEDTVRGCASLLSRWLGLGEEARAGFTERARKVFEEHYTIKRAAVSLLSTIYLTNHARLGEQNRLV